MYSLLSRPTTATDPPALLSEDNGNLNALDTAGNDGSTTNAESFGTTAVTQGLVSHFLQLFLRRSYALDNSE